MVRTVSGVEGTPARVTLHVKVVLKVDERRGFAWQDELAARLAAAGHAVAFRPVPNAPAWPRLVEAVAAVERLAYRHRGPALHAPSASRKRAESAEADLIVDLSGRDEADDPDALRPLYDGSPDPAAILAALLDGRTPRVAIERGGRLLATGLPANERPDVLAAGLDFVFARVVDLICGAVARAGTADATSPADGPPPRIGLRPARFALASLGGKLAARLTRRLTRPRSWRVGWRPLDGPAIRDTGTVPPDGFTWLPNDPRRYFADPFLFAHEGRLWAFVEEYSRASGRGIISAFPIDADGRPGEPRPVLDTGHHLSYPYVFAEGGAVWMIPESPDTGEVALYRATDFPWRWRRERALVGTVAADATPVWHGGRLWLFATERGRSAAGAAAGSSWDALSLWSAPGLDGSFEPHGRNPVLIDAAGARPAGRMWRRGGDLMRLAQDCRAGYGAAIAVCRVDRLDPGGYAQSVERIVSAPPAWRASGLHTLDAAGGFEIIDCLRRAD